MNAHDDIAAYFDTTLSAAWTVTADEDYKMTWRRGAYRRPEAILTVDDGQVTLAEFEEGLLTGESKLTGTAEQVCLRADALLALAGLA